MNEEEHGCCAAAPQAVCRTPSECRRQGCARQRYTQPNDHFSRRLRQLNRSRDRIARLRERLDNPPLESDEAKQVAGVVKGILDLLSDVMK